MTYVCNVCELPIKRAVHDSDEYHIINGISVFCEFVANEQLVSPISDQNCNIGKTWKMFDSGKQSQGRVYRLFELFTRTVNMNECRRW